MTTYIAWDGNEYPLPTPEGWYLGSDDRWWPAGHGPGPAVEPSIAAPPPPPGMPSVPPPMDTFGAPPMGERETIYSAPPPGSGRTAGEPFVSETNTPSGGNGKPMLIAAAVLLGLVAVGAGAWFALSSDGDDEAAPATTVFQTQIDDDEGSTAATAPDTDDDPDTDDGADTTETTAAVIASRGSADDPHAVGETIVVEYEDFDSGELRTWNIEVLEPLRDLTDAVAEENQFNDPPPADARFMGAPVRVTYVSGPAPASLFELTFKAVGPSGVVLATFDPSCGVVPDALDTFAELFPGGAVEGNVCWTVGSADQADLTMIVEVFFDDATAYVDLTG